MLEARVRAPTTPQRDVLRARIVLLAAQDRSTRSIARELGTMPRTLSLWRGRYAREGLAGLVRAPARRPEAEIRRGDATAHPGGPEAAATGRSCAQDGGFQIAPELGDVHVEQVWRFLRRMCIARAARNTKSR